MFPRKLKANVLLLDGEIINWKTGTTSWEDGMWISSRQPLNITMKVDEERLTSETFSKDVISWKENSLFFEVTAKEFYKMFPLSEFCRNNLHQPY